jgi:hypothetical protein
MQPIQNTKVLAYTSDDPKKRTEWANFWVTNGFDGNDTKVAHAKQLNARTYFTVSNSARKTSGKDGWNLLCRRPSYHCGLQSCANGIQWIQVQGGHERVSNDSSYSG